VVYFLDEGDIYDADFGENEVVDLLIDSDTLLLHPIQKSLDIFLSFCLIDSSYVVVSL